MTRYNTKQLKHLAVKSLRKTMPIFLTAYLIYFIINTFSSSLLSTATGVTSLIDYETGELLASLSPTDIAIYLISSYILSLILSVLDVGFNKMFLTASREENISWRMLFYGFSHQPDRILMLQLLLGGLSLGCLLPGYLLMLVSGHMGTPANLIFALLGLLILMMGLILSYYLTILYSQGMFLLADEDSMDALTALKESKRLMHRNKMRYFLLSLSFIGLRLLCYLTLNLGTFFLYPYMGMSKAFFFRNIIGEIGENESVLYS